MNKWLIAAAAVSAGLMGGPARARLARLEIVRTEPAFGGQGFGNTGAYKHVVARAHGTADPSDPSDAIVQDLWLAPRDAKGLVEYDTDVEFLKPVDMALGNRMVLVEVPNRGNKLALASFQEGLPVAPAERNALRDAGDGHLMREGYAIVWFGWQMDVLPGANRIGMPPVVAHERDGRPITGTVRLELATPVAAPFLTFGNGWLTRTAPSDGYPTVALDNRVPLSDGFEPTLTVRDREAAERAPIVATKWSFARCGGTGAPVPDAKAVCLEGGFEPGKLYELTYRAKDPTVAGLGFIAARDLGAFLRDGERDDAGTANPLYRAGLKTILEGSSQSGRFTRSFVQLGFNQIEGGGRAYDGVFAHISAGLMPLNMRFAQPARAWGGEIDRQYPGYDFPFTYLHQYDPISERAGGLFDRCAATNTCPRLFHVASSLEMWEGRQSLGLTDPLGKADRVDPPDVRDFLMTSAQHGPAPLPLPTTGPFNGCQQQPNPPPQVHTMRALLRDLTLWVRDGTAPPASVVPRIAGHTLVAADEVRFPAIPANSYGGVARPAMTPRGFANALHVIARGPAWMSAISSGIAAEPPVEGTASYGVLVPQTDQDGNDLGGIRSVYLQVPIGTYTGWNLFRPDWFGGGHCNLTGSFVPFATSQAEREAAGDPRRSIAERYPNKDAYVDLIRIAARELVSQRFLLEDDAAAMVGRAEREGIRTGP